MPYVHRNEDGDIVGLSRHAEPGAEILPADHPDVQAWQAARAQKVAQAIAPQPVSDVEARLALLEEKTGGAPDDAAVAAKRTAMRAARDAKKGGK